MVKAAATISQPPRTQIVRVAENGESSTSRGRIAHESVDTSSGTSLRVSSSRAVSGSSLILRVTVAVAGPKNNATKGKRESEMETPTKRPNLANALQTLAARVMARAQGRVKTSSTRGAHEDETAHIEQWMTRNPRTCGPDDSLDHAARIMWENDCGCVPVVDAAGRVSAMITDRDICIAAYSRGRPLGEISVSSAASRRLVAARADDTLEIAESLMRQLRIRRLPVVDTEGRPVGVLSMSDLARHAQFGPGRGGLDADRIARTLAAISQPASGEATAG